MLCCNQWVPNPSCSIRIVSVSYRTIDIVLRTLFFLRPPEPGGFILCINIITSPPPYYHYYCNDIQQEIRCGCITHEQTSLQSTSTNRISDNWYSNTVMVECRVINHHPVYLQKSLFLPYSTRLFTAKFSSPKCEQSKAWFTPVLLFIRHFSVAYNCTSHVIISK